MPGLLIWALLAAAVVVGVRGRPRPALMALTATWLLVPGLARVPGAVDGQLFIHRVVVAATLLGLLRGVLLGRIDRSVFAIRGVHAAFAAYLLVGLLDGLVLAGSEVPTSLSLLAYVDLVYQAVFFVTALALFRAAGARQAAGVVAGVAGVVAVLGIAEHVLGWSWSQWFAQDLADPTGLMSSDLAQRGPHRRIRVAGAFSLEMGWVTAMLIPVTVAVALLARRYARLVWVVPAGLLLSMVWTWSRSAYAGLAVGLAVLGLGFVLDRPRRVLPLGAIGLVLAGALLRGPLRRALEVGVTGGEQDVRFERLPDILGFAADRPISGLGLAGLEVRRIPVVDISWLSTYATLGLLGVLALAATLLAAAHAAGRFVQSGPSPARTIAAGAAGAVVAAPIGFASYDLGTLYQSTETVWAMVALALAANEELGVLPRPLVRRTRLVPPLAIAFGIVGVVAGGVLAVTVPGRATIDAAFTTVDPGVAAAAPGEQTYTFKVLSQTACVVVDAADLRATVRCQDLDQVGGGIGTLRVESPTRAGAEAAYDEARQRLLGVFPKATVGAIARGSGRPTWATTAPLWLGAVGLAAGATMPDRAARPPLAPPGSASATKRAPVRVVIRRARGDRGEPGPDDPEPSRPVLLRTRSPD